MSEASSHKSVPAGPSGSSVNPQLKGGSSRSTELPRGDGQQTVISSRPPALNLDFHGQTPFEAASHWEGEQLGQFILQKFIGGGGMGIVFRALDTTLDREVAVKVLSRDQSADDETLRRFRNEAQSAARLSHDNIAHVFYVGEDRGVHYIVFEFIEGVNIRDLVEQHGRLPLEEALSYTYQIAQALEHASQRAVIHRDIKPSNVLVTPDGKAKLVDMGLARLHQIAQMEGDLTASGVTLGTFDYISPEQARDPRSADVRSDLYSLGCSLFFMLTGRPPFPDGTVLQKLLQHQGDSPPDPREFRSELPAEVTRILGGLLAKNPAQRYQTPGELTDELTALGETLGMQLGGSRGAWIAPRRRYPLAGWQHHLPWIIPVSALFLVVLALDFYWSPRGSDTAGTVPLAPVPLAPVPRAFVPPVPPVPRVPVQQPEPGPPVVQPRAEPPVISDDLGPFDLEPIAPAVADPAVEAPTVSDPPLPPAKAAGPAGGGIEFFTTKLPEILDTLAERAKKSSAPAKSPTSRASTPDRSESPPGTLVRPAPTNVPAESVPAGKRLLVVSDEPGPANYISLHAACSAAKDNDTIELRYDGRRAPERPIEISNKHLTVRGGQGFRPLVVFEPQQETNPFKTPPAMVSVAGGELAVSSVDWQFVLPPNVPPHWALFETRGCDLLEFRDCTLTIQGQTAYQARVAFFDIKAPPGVKSMNMDDAMEAHVVMVNLQNCIARGEATFLRDDELQSVRLNWDNGLLATSDRLFAAGGNSLQPRHDVRAELTLRHVTAMVAGGLALLTNSQEAPYQLMTQIRCDDCILATKNPSPLIEQRGSDLIAQYQTRFQWSGEHDYFDGFDVFWRIMNSAGQSGSKQLDFEQWSQLWQGTSRNQAADANAVVWVGLPSDDRPFHVQTPSDYVLDDEAGENGATDGASDRRDAGFLLLELPPVPSPTKPAEARESGS